MAKMKNNNYVDFVKQEEIMTDLQNKINEVTKKYLFEEITPDTIPSIQAQINSIVLKSMIMDKLPRIIYEDNTVWELRGFDVIEDNLDNSKIKIESKWCCIGKAFLKGANDIV